MARKVLVVIDVQNDFAKGGVLAYGYPAESNTEAIIAKVKETLANGDFVIATRDTHHENYLNTLEGKMLPVAHCLYKTNGWNLVGELNELVERGEVAVVDKPTFGAPLVASFIREASEKYGPIDEIQICGYLTEVCVLVNASLLRTAFPDMKIFVLANLCGSVDKDSFESAISCLKAIQIEVK